MLLPVWCIMLVCSGMHLCSQQISIRCINDNQHEGNHGLTEYKYVVERGMNLEDGLVLDYWIEELSNPRCGSIDLKDVFISGISSEITIYPKGYVGQPLSEHLNYYRGHVKPGHGPNDISRDSVKIEMDGNRLVLLTRNGALHEVSLGKYSRRRTSLRYIWNNRRLFSGNVVDSSSNDNMLAARMHDGSFNFFGKRNHALYEIAMDFENIVNFDVGLNTVMFVDADGSVNAFGTIDCKRLQVPASVVDAIDVAAGADHSLALTRDGTVVAWGRNDAGQCNVPEIGERVIDIAAGASHSLALTRNGTVVAWGRNDAGQCNVPEIGERVIDIAAGADHSLALMDNGKVAGWGEQEMVISLADHRNRNIVDISACESGSAILKSSLGRIVFEENETTTNVSVYVQGDIETEQDEYFTVVLVPENDSINHGNMYIRSRIIDDD